MTVVSLWIGSVARTSASRAGGSIRSRCSGQASESGTRSRRVRSIPPRRVATRIRSRLAPACTALRIPRPPGWCLSLTSLPAGRAETDQGLPRLAPWSGPGGLRLPDDLDLEALGVLEVERRVLLPARVREAVGVQLVPSVRRRFGAQAVQQGTLLGQEGKVVDAGTEPVVRLVDLVRRALHEQVGPVRVRPRGTVDLPPELA